MVEYVNKNAHKRTNVGLKVINDETIMEKDVKRNSQKTTELCKYCKNRFFKKQQDKLFIKYVIS